MGIMAGWLLKLPAQRGTAAALLEGTQLAVGGNAVRLVAGQRVSERGLDLPDQGLVEPGADRRHDAFRGAARPSGELWALTEPLARRVRAVLQERFGA